MPRAALLSIHARVEGTRPSTWEDPSLVQLWGPRFSAYVVPARDHPIFSVARFPDDARGQRVAHDVASRLHMFLAGRRIKYGDAGHALGMQPNGLRYGAATGRILIRWDGARQPTVWTVTAPAIDPPRARTELARRYLHVFGPATLLGFATWAGIAPVQARVAFDALARSLTAARTPVGDAWILSSDEPSFRSAPGRPASARLLPSGDAYFLLQGADREILVPEADRRRALWTPRVWPGAVLVDGDVVGTWRRASADVTVQSWRRLSRAERETIEAEAASLPLPDLRRPIRVSWV